MKNKRASGIPRSEILGGPTRSSALAALEKGKEIERKRIEGGAVWQNIGKDTYILRPVAQEQTPSQYDDLHPKRRRRGAKKQS